MTMVEDKTCWTCEYLPVCDAKNRVREKLSGNDDLLELFKIEAEGCKVYTPNIDDLYRQQLREKQKTTVEVQTH